MLIGRSPPGRADFHQHADRGAGLPDAGGIDFAPVANPTEIVPAASGYTLRVIDREINFIYSAISEGKHPFSKNDSEKIMKTLQGYIQEVPRLTAPIKESGRAGDYRYLSGKPLRVYGE